MFKLKVSQYLKFALILLLGISLSSYVLESTNPTPKFITKNIPLLQGKYTRVGALVVDSLVYDQIKGLQVKLDSDTPLAGLRVMGKVEGLNAIVLAEKSAPKSLEKLTFNSKNVSGLTEVWVEIMPQKDHDLLDKIKVSVPKVKIGRKSIRLKSSSNKSSFRLAYELRNYGMDGVHSFRIPGLVTTPKGTLLAVYDIRHNSSVDLQGDIDVGLSRSTDKGQTWSKMQTIMDMGTYGGLPEDQNGIGDPAILVDPETGHIWVIALWAHGKPGEMIWWSSKPGISPQETGQMVITKSEDDGLTWSEPVNITTQMKDPKWNLFFNGPGKGIVMKDGTLVFAAQYKDEHEMPYSTIIYSKDKGKTWKVGTGAKSNTTEAQVVELSDNSLMLNMRDNRGGSRSVAISHDMGESWTEHSSSRSALVEPVCMASIIENPYEEQLLFSNPAASNGRYNMTIKLSVDEGISWPKEHQILLDEGSGWGYSCLTMVDKDLVGILYESSVANMTFQLVKLEELIEN